MTILSLHWAIPRADHRGSPSSLSLFCPPLHTPITTLHTQRKGLSYDLEDNIRPNDRKAQHP